MVYGVIYIIRNTINNKVYVGQHIGTDVEKRWKVHEKPHSRCFAIRNAIQKYKIDNFEKRVICVCKVGEQERLDALERYFIKKYNSLSPNGYNLTTGGRGGVPTEETREKISQALMGHVLSDETKQKISQSHTGKTLSPEHKAKIGVSSSGKIVSDETKLKISQSHTGKTLSPEHKAKISDARKGIEPWNKGIKSPMSGENHPWFGKNHKVETKQKISDAHTGKPLNDDHKAKISASTTGSNNHFYGKKHTDETREKMRKAKEKLGLKGMGF